MRYGIVSDIHANIQAWKAVLRDMEKEGVDMILCLGDVIGYGPNPAEVLDSCYANIDHFLLGNHDAVIGNRLDSSLFNDNAKYLIEWTRDQLNEGAAEFFGDMPLQMEGEGFVCAHGELALPGRFGYIYEANDAIESFTSNDSPLMFVGHTHLPAKIALDMQRNQVLNQAAADGFLLPHERYLINVGSVGDPRDGETTASYCIFDQEKNFIKFRKVQFNVEAFRKSLMKAQLPVSPFFLKVYDGMKAETQTIKDMEVMEANQAIEAKKTTQKISNVPSDIKKRRNKVTFSMDTVEQTKQYKARESSRREIEASNKKKGGKVIIALVAGLIFVFIIIILAVKANSGGSGPANPDQLVNKPKNTKKDTSVLQEVSGDFLLTAKDADLPEEIEITDGFINWQASSQEIAWTLSVKKTGYFRVLMTAEKEGDTDIKLAAADSNLNPTLKSDKGTTVQDLGWFLIEKKVNTKLKLSSSSDPNAKIKSLKLKYLGQEKPNPYGNLDDIEFATMESPYYPAGWMTEGAAFNPAPISAQTLQKGHLLKGTDGNFAIASLSRFAPDFNTAKQYKGSLISPEFEIKHSYINMLGRGSGDFSTQVILLIKKEEIHKMPIPSGSGSIKSFHFDVKEFIGMKARLIFKDNSTNNFLAVDRIAFTNKKEGEFKDGTGSIRGELAHSKIDLNVNKIMNEAGNKLLNLELAETVSELEKIKRLPEIKSRDYFRTVRAALAPFNVDSLESTSGNQLISSGPGQFLLKKTSDKNEDTYKLSGTFEQNSFKSLRVRSIDHGGKAGTGEDGKFDVPEFKMKILKQAPVKGRYIRVFKKSPALTLIEVEVMSGGINVASGKKCLQSSIWGNAQAGFAVDGRRNTDFRRVEGSSTDDKSPNPWWMVDLGKEYPIEQIKVLNRTDRNFANRLNNSTYMILDSAKRVTWRTFIAKAGKVIDIPVTSEFNVKFKADLATKAKNAGMLPGKIFSFNSEWNYYDSAEKPGKDWYTNGYDDSKWKKGKGSFGYGKKPTTNLGHIKKKILGFYLRKKFILKDNNKTIKLNCIYDDGFAVFLNGQETKRVNVKDITHNAKADKKTNDPVKTSITLNPKHLKAGENLISVIVKNQSLNSSDIHFDAELIESQTENSEAPKMSSINSLNTALASDWPIATKGEKFEITMKFPNTDAPNLLSSFGLSTNKEVPSAEINDYIKRVKALPTAKEKILASFKKDIGKEIQLTIIVKKEEKTFPVTVKKVDEKAVNVIFKGKPNKIPFKIISEKDIKARLVKYPDGDLLFSYYKKTLADDLANMTLNQNSPLQELLHIGKNNLRGSVNYGIYGRYIEIWQLKEEATSSWVLKVNSAGKEITTKRKKTLLSTLYPKMMREGYNATDLPVIIHDIGRDKNFESIKLDNIKGHLVTNKIIIRDSNGKITWQNRDFNVHNIKAGFRGFNLEKKYLTPPYENLALNKPFTQSSKGHSYGINDGIVALQTPFFYATGAEPGFPKTVVIDLESEKEFNTFLFTKMERGATYELTFSVSRDNKEFKNVRKHIFDINRKMTNHTISFERVQARYIKLSFKNIKNENGHPNFYQSLLSEFEAYNIPD